MLPRMDLIYRHILILILIQQKNLLIGLYSQGNPIDDVIVGINSNYEDTSGAALGEWGQR